MRFQPPIKLHSKLSQRSILALAGLMVFAAALLVANPFSIHTSGSGSVPTANASPPSSGAGGTGGQGSLITGTPSPSQSGGSGSGASGGHHHHSSGNSTDY